MSYISPEFQLNTSKDIFVSLLYADKKKSSSGGVEQITITDEINDYMVIPHIDDKLAFKKAEQLKINKNILHLGTLPDKRRVFIDENGTLMVK